MNGGQQILAIGAIVLLSFIVLSYGNTSNGMLETAFFNEGVISGSALAQSLMEEIQSRAFDEATISQAVTSVNDLTSSYSLGPDNGESNISSFDDVDDYNGYTKTDSLSRMGNFTLSVDIYYVEELNPEVKSLSKTFSKRIDVEVANSAVSNSITYSNVVSY